MTWQRNWELFPHCVTAQIDDEREHKLIDRDVLKNVLAIYVEIGSGGLRIYQVDFEQAYLESTRNYYSRKFQSWNLEYSDDHDYKLKVAAGNQGCLHFTML